MANDIEINVRVANQTGGGLTSVNASMNGLRQNAQSAGTALTRLNARALTAAASLGILAHAADEAGDALGRIEGRATAATTALGEARTSSTQLSTSLRSVSRSATSAEGRMDIMSTRAGVLRDRMGELDGSLRRVGGSLGAIRGGFGSLSTSAGDASGSMNRLIMAAMALAPALIPIAAAAVPLAAGMAAAGAATAIFTAALIPQFSAMGDAIKAEDKYQKSLESHASTSKAAAKAEGEYLASMSAMPPAVQQAASSLTVLKDAYKGWSDSLAGDTLPVVTKGFAVLTGMFPKLTPVVQGASAQLDRFMMILAGGVQSPGFDSFMQKFAAFSTQALAKAVSGVVRLGEALREGGSARNGIGEFMQFARDVGPAVGETLRNLAEMLGRLLVAAADTGVGVLSLVNAFAQLVNAIPPEMLSRLVQLAVAFASVRLAMAALAAVGPAVAAAATATAAFSRAARFAGVASAISGVTQQLTLMQKSTIVLAALTAVVIGINELAEKAKGAPPDVDRLTTSLKRLGEAGKFTGELKSTFGDMDGFVRKVEEMRAASEGFDRAKTFTSLTPMGPLLDKAAKKIDELVRGTKSLSAVKEDFKGLDESFANLARGGFADEAATQFQRFEAALRASGRTTSEITALFPQYGAAVASLKAEQELVARSMGLFGEQAMAVKAKLDSQKASTDGLRQAIVALNDVNRAALGGMIGFEASIDAAAKAAKDNAGSLDMVNGVLDLNGEKSRTAASALADLAAKTDEAASAARDNGASWETVNGIWERGRAKLLESAQAMGLTRAEALALAEQILATPDKTARLKGNMEDLQAKLNDAHARLASVPDSRKAAVRAEISDLEAKVRTAQARLDSLSDETVYIDTVLRTFRQGEINDMNAGRAHGGIIGAAGGGPRSRMTLVGEQGPELVDLAPGSRVRSNPDSKRIADGMAGGGGGPVVLELRSSGSRIDDFLLEALRGAIRVKGGDVQLVLGSSNR